MDASQFLERVREELKPLNQYVINHPLLAEAEAGKLPLDRVRLFVENQYYIVFHDVRSLAIMVSRASDQREAEYLTTLLNGDVEGFKTLKILGEELNIPFRDFTELRILHEAVSYTHYLAWLAFYANPGEQVFALIVNLPVWGGGCSRLGKALKTVYNVKNTQFLDLFANIPDTVEKQGLEVVEKYLPQSGGRMRLFARMIQGYESMFWDAIYRAGVQVEERR